MSNTKHTPGPWGLMKYNDGTPLVVTNDDGTAWVSWTYSVGIGMNAVAEVTAYSNGQEGTGYRRPNTQAEARANACLIAAAPELLEALSIIANALSPNSLPVNGMMASYDHALMVREEADRAFEVARAAIAKATQP